MKVSIYTNNSGQPRNKIDEYLSAINQWFLSTPERALQQAYKAALTIKSIEDEHFNGNKISPTASYSDNVMFYFQAQLENNLNTAKMRMAEFKASRSFITISNAFTLEKIRFIDETLDKYVSKNTLALVPISQNISQTREPNEANQIYSSPVDIINVESVPDKPGVLPRSIGRTFNRLKTELNPKSEAEVVKNFYSSRAKTRIAIRFLLTLLIVPLLTQQLSKEFLVSPIVQHFRGHEAQTFLNHEMKEEALKELQLFEEELKFASLVEIPHLSPESIEEKVKHKAAEITEEFKHKSGDAVSNVFADLIAIVAFVAILLTSQKEIAILKSFMDDIVYGLSDSAKAFLIILLTDIFVGFHSSHGWEVMLEGLASHLGIAASKSSIFLFIATFPVILDTIFKYWIFRYLSRVSPSAVATLRNMNE